MGCFETAYGNSWTGIFLLRADVVYDIINNHASARFVYWLVICMVQEDFLRACIIHQSRALLDFFMALFAFRSLLLKIEIALIAL